MHSNADNTAAVLGRVSLMIRGLLEPAAARPGGLPQGTVQLLQRTIAATQGGKQLRPRLTASVHAGLGGQHEDAAAWAAAAFELLHTAFVLHDDVIDGDWRRRGAPNLPGLYRADYPPGQGDRVGQTAGIVAGDIALHAASKAIRNAARLLPATDADRLHTAYDDAILVTASGELADVAAENVFPDDPNVVIRIAYAKTAVYTFEAPLAAGAIAAGATPSVVNTLRRFGKHLGIAYQIRDDIIGTFGHETSSGKSASNDITTGKATLAMAHARTTPAWPALALALTEPRSPAQIRTVRGLLRDCGALAWCERREHHHQQQARQQLRALPPPLAENLTHLTAALHNRHR